MACSSTPARVAAPPAPPPKKEVVEVKEPEPPPEPLASADVAFEQKWEFVKLNLMQISADRDFMPEDEIVKKLPTAQRAEYQALQRAQKQLADANDRSMTAMSAMFRARSSNKKGLDAQYKLAAAAKRKAQDAVSKARLNAQQSLQKAMDKSPSAEVGLALARLYTKHADSGHYDSGRTLAYGYVVRDGDSRAAVAPLRRAAAVTSLDQLGKYVRFELIHHLMATQDAKDAKPFINELLGVVPWDQKPILLLRLGIIQGLENQDALAAETFRSAHEHLATSSRVDRRTLLMSEIVARYRAQQFERVLAVAEEQWSESHAPKPLKPDPNPPPPPPPAPTPKAKGKSTSSTSRTAGILASLDSSSFSMLGALSSNPLLSDSDALRFATDAVERLERNPAQMKSDTEFRAGIAARLAVRALYRSDDEAAKEQGETAKSLGGSASRDGVRVLKVLAKRAGDEHAASELDEALRKLDYGSAAYGSGIEPRYLDEELRETKSADEKPSTTPVVERNVRSLVRLCLEPIHQRLPEKAELKVSAKVFPNGKVEPVVEGNAGSDVDTCIKQMAGRVLIHAPTSVSAKVAVARLDPDQQSMWGSGLGSIFGDSLGESFGVGGLGLRGSGIGGGGSGEGVGLGSIGGIGWGTPGAGIGGGRGQLGRKVKKPPPKKPAQPPKTK